MKFLEKDLERIIYETPNEKLIRNGLPINSNTKKLRQVRIGNYGIADLILVKRHACWLEITICELKKDKIGISAFLQAIRYAKGVQEFFKQKKPDMIINLKLMLIGSDIDMSGSFCFIPSLFDTCMPENRCITSISFHTYHYDIDGLLFKDESNYKLSSDGFGEGGYND